jgi:hypothetical protein
MRISHSITGLIEIGLDWNTNCLIAIVGCMKSDGTDAHPTRVVARSQLREGAVLLSYFSPGWDERPVYEIVSI